MPKPTTILTLLLLGLLLLLLVILLRRALYRRFPIFFAYCMLRALITIPRLVAEKYPTPYFVLYWTTEAVNFVVSFAAMIEILGPYFEVIDRRRRWARLILPGGIGLVVLISLLPVILRPINPTLAGHFASAVYTFVILMCVLEVTVFIFAVRLRRRYRLEWSGYETGILVGFGALALVSLFAYYVPFLRVLHLRPSPLLESMYRYSLSGGLIPGVIAWLIAFWRPEHPQDSDPPDLSRYPELAEVLKQRSEILKEVMRKLGFKLVAKPGLR